MQAQALPSLGVLIMLQLMSLKEQFDDKTEIVNV